jgi:hypothetical protein
VGKMDTLLTTVLIMKLQRKTEEKYLQIEQQNSRSVQKKRSK